MEEPKLGIVSPFGAAPTELTRHGPIMARHAHSPRPSCWIVSSPNILQTIDSPHLRKLKVSFKTPRPFLHLAQSSAHPGPRTTAVWYSVSCEMLFGLTGLNQSRFAHPEVPAFHLACRLCHTLYYLRIYLDLGLM